MTNCDGDCVIAEKMKTRSVMEPFRNLVWALFCEFGHV